MPDRHTRLDQLRQRAEALLRLGTNTPEHLDDETIEGLLHELNVYHVELELQLEDLEAANSRLESAQRRYASLFENAPVGYVITNHAGVIQQANITAATMLHTDPHTLHETPMAACVTTASQDAYHLLRRRVLTTQEAVEAEIVLCRSDDSTFDAHFVTQQTPFEEIHFAFVDVSVMKRAEEALRRTLERERRVGQLRDRMIEIIAHEFRTPLTSILMANKLLAVQGDRQSEEKRARRHRTIQNMVWHLHNMVDAVKSAHTFEEGLPQMQTRPFDLIDYIGPLVDDIAMLNENKGRLTLELAEPQAEEPVTWDRTLLQSILTNLIANALKYSEEDVQVRVVFQADTVRFEVTDQGPGIPQEDQEHMYEAFYRGDEARFQPGTGIGLYVVERAVAAHGGSIHCQSTPGEGTTFRVRLPRHVEPA